MNMDLNNGHKVKNSNKSNESLNTSSKGHEWEHYSKNLDHSIDDDDYLNEINSLLAKQVNNTVGDEITDQEKREQKNNKKSYRLRIFTIGFSIIMLLFSILIFTGVGKEILLNIVSKHIYDNLEYVESESNKDTDIEALEAVPIKEVINILLLGVEEIENASNTDVMIVASMNTKDKSIKLISLMRDLYVQIPDHGNDRLNSAYAKDGIDLLYKTIFNNFGINIDGYILVNFDSFEKVVDLLDGVEVTLTSKEAKYLNKTNYISNPAYRNVIAGTQIFNGNQALGYCRIRKVSTGTEHYDFGRTQRQRAVLNALFEKVKSKNILSLGLLMNDILTNINIKTDITENEFNNYLKEAVNIEVKKLENYRIPSDGSYIDEKVQIGKLKNQAVLIPSDLDATREEIRQFIYEN